MFVPENLTFFANEDIDCPDFEEFIGEYFENFKNQNIKAYIVGFATKKMQEDALGRTFAVENPNANAELRTYANLLIKDSPSPEKFLEVLQHNCS